MLGPSSGTTSSSSTTAGTEAVPVAGWSVQYAAAGGTTYQRTPLTGTIRPGRYYLVQEAAGANAASARGRPPDAERRGHDRDGGGRRQGRLGDQQHDAHVRGRLRWRSGARRQGLRRLRRRQRLRGAADTGPLELDRRRSASRAATSTPTTTCSTSWSAPPNPRNTPPPASVTATDPADGENDVALDSNVTVTFSADVTPTFGITCAQQRRPRVHPDRRPDRVHARPDDRLRARRELHGHRPHRGPRRRLQLHDARARGHADPRHPGRAAPLAVREPGRQRRARRRHGREHERHLGPGRLSRTPTTARPRASSCSARARGRRSAPRSRSAAPVQEFKAAQLGAGEPVADRDLPADRDGRSRAAARSPRP